MYLITKISNGIREVVLVNYVKQCRKEGKSLC